MHVMHFLYVLTFWRYIYLLGVMINWLSKTPELTQTDFLKVYSYQNIFQKIHKFPINHRSFFYIRIIQS